MMLNRPRRVLVALLLGLIWLLPAAGRLPTRAGSPIGAPLIGGPVYPVCYQPPLTLPPTAPSGTTSLSHTVYLRPDLRARPAAAMQCLLRVSAGE